MGTDPGVSCCGIRWQRWPIVAGRRFAMHLRVSENFALEKAAALPERFWRTLEICWTGRCRLLVASKPGRIQSHWLGMGRVRGFSRV